MCGGRPRARAPEAGFEQIDDAVDVALDGAEVGHLDCFVNGLLATPVVLKPGQGGALDPGIARPVQAQAPQLDAERQHDVDQGRGLPGGGWGGVGRQLVVLAPELGFADEGVAEVVRLPEEGEEVPLLVDGEEVGAEGIGPQPGERGDAGDAGEQVHVEVRPRGAQVLVQAHQEEGPGSHAPENGHDAHSIPRSHLPLLGGCWTGYSAVSRPRTCLQSCVILPAAACSSRARAFVLAGSQPLFNPDCPSVCIAQRAGRGTKPQRRSDLLDGGGERTELILVAHTTFAAPLLTVVAWSVVVALDAHQFAPIAGASDLVALGTRYRILALALFRSAPELDRFDSAVFKSRVVNMVAHAGGQIQIQV
ncbi:hypothetical protein PG990_011653 [Apiospora arundinis]